MLNRKSQKLMEVKLTIIGTIDNSNASHGIHDIEWSVDHGLYPFVMLS